MKPRAPFLETGQSLAIVAIVMFAFLAMLVLVLDGGYAYYQRRVAQNAADGGALAAASTWCETDNWAQAYNAGIEYSVTRNDVDSATVNQVNPDHKIVRVDTTITFDTFFGSLFRRENLTATATATAGCYSVASGIGVMPIAWSCHQPLEGEVSDSEDCTIQYMVGDQCTVGYDPIYMIADSSSFEVDIVCQDPSTGLPALGLDCDLDDDGENDITLLSGGNRTWLDLNGGGGGGAELKDWLTGGFEDEVFPHYWVPAQSGVNASVYDTVYNELIGNDVIIPVFDKFCPGGAPDDNNPDLDGCFWDTGEDFVVGNEPKDYFHLISFSMFRTICVESGSHKGCDGRVILDEILELAGWSHGEINSLMTIEGCFKEGFVPGVKPDPDSPDVGVWTVLLIE